MSAPTQNTAAAFLPGCGTTPAGDLPARRGLPLLGGALQKADLVRVMAIGSGTAAHHPDAATPKPRRLQDRKANAPAGVLRGVRSNPAAASNLPVRASVSSLWNFPAVLVAAGLFAGGAA